MEAVVGTTAAEGDASASVNAWAYREHLRCPRSFQPVQVAQRISGRWSSGSFVLSAVTSRIMSSLVFRGGEEPPSDIVPREAWEGMIDLPTDVLLRTTDYLGRMVDDLHGQGTAWIHAMPMQLSDSQFMFEPALDASDEFQAAPFVALHGWYRQATAGLRNALEAMACGSAFAARADTARYASWRDGTFEPKFGNAIESLAADPRLAAFDNRVGSPGLFGRKPDGVAQETYNKLCRYAHSRAGYTNADIWQSNGPVFIGSAFTQFRTDFCDAVALCYVLLKIGWPKLALPGVARPLFGWASQRWNGIGDAVEAEFFPT